MIATIYTKKTCSYCVEAKKLLNEKNIKFDEKRIDTDTNLRSELLNLVPNVRTVPQIFVDNKHIGGYTDLVEFLDSN